MNEQVGDHQHRVGIVLADGDGDDAAVLPVHNTVKGQGHGGPLILLDAAVVVGLEVGDLGILIQGIGLQVHPGRVHMGGADVGTLGKALFAHDGQDDALFTVDIINLIAGVQGHSCHEGLEAVVLGSLGGPGSGLPLGLAGIHEGSVALAVSLHLGTLGLVDTGVAVLGGSQKLAAEFVGGHKKVSFL